MPSAQSASTRISAHTVTAPAHKRGASTATKTTRAAKRKPASHKPVKAATTAAKPSPRPKTASRSTTTPRAAAKPRTPSGVTVDARSAGVGTILVASNGLTLYLFKKDKGTASTCFGACAGVWPAYTTNGPPMAGPGVRQSLLGTTARNDGTTQVTYAGHPLYRFVGDGSPGAITGQGLTQFGAKWFVVSPSGAAIKRR
jgi:predicted lipoprotein with Yx(FWY)xxD motif